MKPSKIKMTEKRQLLYEVPGTERMVDYATYRAITGKCETCGAEMNDHPKCDACGALCGPGHLHEKLSPYQGFNLCGECKSMRNLNPKTFLQGKPYLKQKRGPSHE